MDRFVTISGCSGGGKSTLLAELGRRGHAVVEEPGRRIVREELAGDGGALPWVDGAAFARRAIAMALDDLEKAAALPGVVFFDRGLVDAAAALAHLTGEPILDIIARLHRTNRKVFMAPPCRRSSPAIASGGMASTRPSPSMNGWRKPIRGWAASWLSCRAFRRPKGQCLFSEY